AKRPAGMDTASIEQYVASICTEKAALQAAKASLTRILGTISGHMEDILATEGYGVQLITANEEDESTFEVQKVATWGTFIVGPNKSKFDISVSHANDDGLGYLNVEIEGADIFMELEEDNDFTPLGYSNSDIVQFLIKAGLSHLPPNTAKCKDKDVLALVEQKVELAKKGETEDMSSFSPERLEIEYRYHRYVMADVLAEVLDKLDTWSARNGVHSDVSTWFNSGSIHKYLELQ
ncbi:hypothetical protein KIPB_005562, partial [Kipferlia bialata]